MIMLYIYIANMTCNLRRYICLDIKLLWAFSSQSICGESDRTHQETWLHRGGAKLFSQYTLSNQSQETSSYICMHVS